MVRFATGALVLVLVGLTAGGIAHADASSQAPRERVYLHLSGLG